MTQTKKSTTLQPKKSTTLQPKKTKINLIQKLSTLGIRIIKKKEQIK
jgi:hypothetical protein